MINDPSLVEKLNLEPINQAALEWLNSVKAAEDASSGLHVLSLALWGLERGVSVPLRHEGERGNLELRVGELCGQPPEKIMRWLVSNPEGPDDLKEQEAHILSLIDEAETAEKAALRVLEEVADHLRHLNTLSALGTQSSQRVLAQ